VLARVSRRRKRLKFAAPVILVVAAVVLLLIRVIFLLQRHLTVACLLNRPLQVPLPLSV